VNYYLLVFNRRTGVMLRLEQFAESDVAMSARFAAELEFRGDGDVEVVVLGAESMDALRRTHSRYFNEPRKLAEDGAESFRQVEASEPVARLRASWA
jgi:hypothetical protein